MKEHLKNEDLVDFLHEALSPEEDAAIYAHLETCAPCRKEHDFEAALGEAVQVYAVNTERELPSSVKAEIWERIRSAKPSALSHLAGWFRPAVAVPIAAAIALGAYFGVTSLGSPGVAPIDAAYYLQDHAAMTTVVPFSDRSEVSPSALQNEASTQSQNSLANIVTASFMADAAP